LSPEGILELADLVVLRPKGLQKIDDFKKNLNQAVGAILAQSNKLGRNEESEKDGSFVRKLKAEDSNHLPCPRDCLRE
jgi:hypothetical protein